MDMCKISRTDLVELDMVIKRALREKQIHGKQCSDERLYLARESGGRGLKSFLDVYFETKTRVACYLVLSGDIWVKEVWN